MDLLFSFDKLALKQAFVLQNYSFPLTMYFLLTLMSSRKKKIAREKIFPIRRLRVN